MNPQQLSNRDQQLYKIATRCIIPVLFPSEWAGYRDKAESKELRDYFQSKVNETSCPFATWPKSK